jgi:hypothetical protein
MLAVGFCIVFGVGFRSDSRWNLWGLLLDLVQCLRSDLVFGFGIVSAIKFVTVLAMTYISRQTNNTVTKLMKCYNFLKPPGKRKLHLYLFIYELHFLKVVGK